MFIVMFQVLVHDALFVSLIRKEKAAETTGLPEITAAAVGWHPKRPLNNDSNAVQTFKHHPGQPMSKIASLLSKVKRYCKH